MKLPWVRSEDEQRAADQQTRFVVSHLKVVLADLARALDKAERTSGRQADG
jgi:hypothetical protein